MQVLDFSTFDKNRRNFYQTKFVRPDYYPKSRNLHNFELVTKRTKAGNALI